MQINLNQKVKVRLTAKGREHLILRHKNIHGKHAKDVPYHPVEEDEQGYSVWQLWDLMGVFGELMQYPTFSPPFETNIEVIENS